jgi:hypothetical protein
MTTFRILGAAAMLAMAGPAEVLAQAAVQEPGAFAFYHPDADVLNAGRPTPAAGGGALASVPFDGSNAHAVMAGGARASRRQKRQIGRVLP